MAEVDFREPQPYFQRIKSGHELKPGNNGNMVPSNPDSMTLIKFITDRIDLSWRHLSNYFDVWDTLEEHYRAFRPADQEDLESLEKNQVQKIIVPIQFATLQTMLTFLMDTFTSFDPVLKCEGADPISTRPARVMELLLGYDYRGNRGYLMFHQWFMNSLRYSYGVMENSWAKTQVLKRTLAPSPKSESVELDGQSFDIPGAMQWIKQYFTTFEGNKWQIVDNRTWYRDPRVSLTNFQKGEFCGRRNFIHDNEIMKMEAQGLFFNSRLCISSMAPAQGVAAESGERVDRRDPGRGRFSPQQAFESEMLDARRTRMHVNEEIIIEIIPRQWGLGPEEMPEQWLFNIIDRRVIVRAEPSPFYQFPYAVVEAYPDILASMSMGLMELTEPLAAHINFLFNSHMANVRKALNDMFVVDPSRVMLQDLLDPKPGKIIRLLPAAYGTDPQTIIRQLQTLDITASNVNDVKEIMQLWSRITGAADTMFGQIAPGRRSAAELQGVMRSAANRLKMMADLYSSEGVSPLTELMAITRQENMTEDQFVQIAGLTAADLGVSPDMIIENYAKVGSQHISGVFQFPAANGIMPVDRQKAADFFKEAFMATAKFPILAAMFDPIEMFKEAARQGGIKNLAEFYRKGIRPQTQILPDDLVANMLARGQVKPYGGTNGVGRGRPDQGIRRSERELSTEGYLNGAGAPQS